MNRENEKAMFAQLRDKSVPNHIKQKLVKSMYGQDAFYNEAKGEIRGNEGHLLDTTWIDKREIKVAKILTGHENPKRQALQWGTAGLATPDKK